MNKYKGYTLTYITINPDMSLTGNIHCDSYFKTAISARSIGTFIQKFHLFVDEDIKCQNLMKELIMNKYKGFKISNISFDEVNLQFKGYQHNPTLYYQGSTSNEFRESFRNAVDNYLSVQELTKCQNFADELLELCKKYEVELTTNSAHQFKVNGKLLHWTDKCKSVLTCISGKNTTGEIRVHN